MNEQNLIPNSERTPSELREITKSGGKKSGEVRRKRKALKECLEIILTTPTNQSKKVTEIIKRTGIEYDDTDNSMAIAIILFSKAISGDIKAIELIRDTVGEKPKDKIEMSGEINNPFSGMTTEELRQIING